MKTAILFCLSLFLLVSCGGGGSSDMAQFTNKKSLNSLFLLSKPVAGARLELFEYPSNKLLSIQTTNSNGEWFLPKLSTNMVKVKIESGAVGNLLLQTPLCAFLTKQELNSQKVIINASKLIECISIEKNATISEILNLKNQKPYNNNNLSAYIIKTGGMDIFLGNKSLQVWKNEDFDNDTIPNWQELLQDLNPANSDSDYDGLNDNIELQTYNTDPKNSDSDEDYIPDGEEISRGSNPLNADENSNGIVDGLEGDPFFEYQWYIYAKESKNICTTTNKKTVAGNDLGILPLYHLTFGKGVIVQVVDGGVDSHEDLDISLAHSINSINGTNDPTPTEGFSNNPVQVFYRGHGTAVAGIIGAIGLNNTGIRGVAPNIKIAGSNWLESEDLAKLPDVWVNSPNANEVAISNNSWGSKFVSDVAYETIMQKASSLRDGKGRIFVFASGNEREEHSNANLSYLLNNPYVIAVTAINTNNKYSSYSTPGSNILVSAYGGEHYYISPAIMSTFTPSHAMYKDDLNGQKGPITIDSDVQKAYTYAMNGTSAAAPMVSGELALVLSVCPNLSYRDIKWLIAHTSTKIDTNNSEWVKNSANLWHNNNYGFGLINAKAIVQKCLDINYKPLPKLLKVSKKIDNLNINIPDNNKTVVQNIFIDENIIIEWVGLKVTIDHPYAGDLDIKLISPSRTTAHIIEPNFLKQNAYKDGFRFSTVALIGEKSKGRWQIAITDMLKDDAGVLKNATLEIWGHKKIDN